MTGLAAMTGQLVGKRLELLRDTVPNLARVAVLWTPESAERAHEFEETVAAAQALGLSLQSVELRPDGNLEQAFEDIVQGRADVTTYGLNGALLNAPHMEKVVGFCEADYPLNSIAAAIWDGHIFINLSQHPVAFSEHLAGLDVKFRPWRMEELEMVERRTYLLKANWKLIIQNYSECVHCPIVHPLLQKLSHYMSGDNEPPQPTYLGGRMDLREGVKTMTMDGKTQRSCLPDLGADDQRHVYYYCLLPNFFLNLHPDYMLTFTMWPKAVDQTDIICEWHFHPDEIRKPGLNPHDAVEFWDITNKQDWELSQRAQEGISSKGYLPGPYSNREELLFALDRFVRKRVG